MKLPSYDDVLAARGRLAGKVSLTPVLQVPRLDALAGIELYLKAENLQRVGAFKARGAINAVLALPPDAREKGLVTFSSGNHGQAVALAARDAGVTSHIVMPEDAPAVKVETVRALGGQVSFAGKTTDDRYKLAHEIAARTGATVIPPFDDADVIAGQGTATVELIEQAASLGAELDAVLVPVGGGGLLAGACLAASGHVTNPKIIAVEPSTADAFSKSFAAKERVTIAPASTIADGLKPIRVGELNFAIAGKMVSHSAVVDDEAIGRALVELLMHGKILVEPSGACALAAALERKLPAGIRRAGVILSGGNLAPAQLAGLIERYAVTAA
jgi:threo-3-hydroxy-L-aspartate ammonia-lyase